MCDFNNSCIVVKVTVIRTAGDAVLFKNCSPYISCITEVNKSQMYEASELNLIILTNYCDKV